jgi:RNA recognition motif-containing protein
VRLRADRKARAYAQLVDVNMPLDNATGKHRGFGFVEFESPEDAAEAIYNMNNGELNGRVLNVNVAKPMTVTERSQKAVWHADADSYFDKEGWNLDQEPSTIVVDDVKPADDGLAPKDPAQPHFG